MIPYLGEIRLFAGMFAPAGWSFCDGSLLDISQNEALFSLIGTTYGGDGTRRFALPDLRGRVPVHQGSAPALGTYGLGDTGGCESVMLSVENLPKHKHQLLVVTTTGTTQDPTDNLPARTGESELVYLESERTEPIGVTASDSPAGPAHPHENRQPFVALNYIIALEGQLPTQPMRDYTFEAFLGEIRIFPFDFAPRDWTSCHGQLMPIHQNSPLFSLLGTQFGGNGVNTFALPNLDTRAPIGAGKSSFETYYAVGEEGGEASVSLAASTSPPHQHEWRAAPADMTADSNIPGPSKSLASATGCTPYAPPSSSRPPVAMDAYAVTPSGEQHPVHNNMMPSMALNFCICTNGIFPIRA